MSPCTTISFSLLILFFTLIESVKLRAPHISSTAVTKSSISNGLVLKNISVRASFEQCLTAFNGCIFDRKTEICTTCRNRCPIDGVAAAIAINAIPAGRIATLLKVCPVLAYGSMAAVCWYVLRSTTSPSQCPATSSDYKFIQGPLFGGPHGEFFDDGSKVRFDERIRSIYIRTGSRVDGVSFVTNNNLLKHGGNGGGEKRIELQLGESITRYEVYTNKKSGHTRLFWIKFTTTFQTIEGGSKSGSYYKYDIPQDREVIGMHGRSGREMDKLGMVMKQFKPFEYIYGPLFGGPHGSTFNDLNGMQSDEFIQTIRIRTGLRVDNVQFITTKRTLSHGGNGGSWKQLTISATGRIERYEVCVGKHYLRTRVFFIRFVTTAGTLEGGKRTSSCSEQLVPYDQQVVGMHGRSGQEVDKIGMVMRSYS